MERRIICGRVGHGRYVKEPDQIDEENGLFPFISLAEMTEFLSDPMTGALYLRYFCIPSFRKFDIDHCKRVVANPELISNSKFCEDTQWLAK